MSPFRSLFPPTEFFKSQRRWAVGIGRTLKEEFKTFLFKVHVNEIWMDEQKEQRRKEEEIRPAKEWSSSIQRMPANLTFTTLNSFCFDLRVFFNAGPLESCWFLVPPVVSVFLVTMETSWAQRAGLKNTLWFPQNSAPGTPWPPPLLSPLLSYLLYL